MEESRKAIDEQLVALRDQRAFADRSAFRKIEVTGSDAERWLNDLLTAPIAGLDEGRAVRSLLLTPTGKIRADVMVAATSEGFLLLQDPRQPTSIGNLLAPYTLSSDVAVRDRTDELALFSLPGGAGSGVGWAGSSPSVLGDGIDLIVAADAAWRVDSMLMKKMLIEVGDEALEIWRIRRGIARFPVDVTEGSLPAEAGLDHTIDVTKGCFLGQEAIAKVRNLGHPPQVVRAVRTDAAVVPGTAVFAGADAVGEVTSAAPSGDGGTSTLVRVAWADADATLSTPDGARFTASPDD